MTRVLLLTAPAPMGGLETVVSALATGLAEAGIPVTLAQMLTPGASSSGSLDAVTHNKVQHVRLVHPARDYRALRDAVVTLATSCGATVMHSHGQRADLIGAFAARKNRLPLVSTVHGFITNTVKQQVARRVHELVLRQMDRVIAVSAPLEHELSRAVGGARVVLVPNAPPKTNRVERAVARQRMGVDNDRQVIGWVGRVSREKGLDVFAEAVAEMHDRESVMVVIGEGPERALVSSMISSRGLDHRFRFLGAVPAAATLFSGFDILVSSSRTEGTPMNVLEAIDASVAVVGTAVGGVPDLIGDGGGWLVPSEQPHALAAALDEALSNDEQRARCAETAAARLQARYDATQWIAAHRSLYSQLERSHRP